MPQWHERHAPPSPLRFMQILITSSLIITSMFGCRLTSPEDGFQKAMEELTRDLIVQGKEVPSPLAMGDFLLEGKECDLGEEIAVSLPDHIVQQRPELAVITRHNFNSILDAQAMQMSDLFAESDSGPGELIPARSLLVGFLFPIDEREVNVVAHVLDLETGQTLKASRARIEGRQAKPLDRFADLPLELEFTASARIRGVEGEILVQEGDVLHSGECLRLRLKPNRPAFLYAFLLDSQGNANLLFPSPSDASARVEGRELSIPSSREYYQLDNHPGKESLLVAASLEPMTDLEDLLARLEREAAKSSDVMDALSRIGHRGFIGISRRDDTSEENKALARIMRSYSGTVWGTLAIEHLP